MAQPSPNHRNESDPNNSSDALIQVNDDTFPPLATAAAAHEGEGEAVTSAAVPELRQQQQQEASADSSGNASTGVVVDRPGRLTVIPVDIPPPPPPPPYVFNSADDDDDDVDDDVEQNSALIPTTTIATTISSPSSSLFERRWKKQKYMSGVYSLFGRVTVRYFLAGLYVTLLSVLLFFYLDGPAFGLTSGLKCWSWKGRMSGGECRDYLGRQRDKLWWERDGSGGGGGGGGGDDVELQEVPSFVTEYAPYVYLYSGERHWPGNLDEHLENTTPAFKYTPIQFPPPSISLDDLGDLSDEFGTHVYLSSNDDPETMPQWLTGQNWNEPDANGRSRAASTFIIADKGERYMDERWGIVDEDEGVVLGNVTDVFYFYFYSFNLGNRVWKWRLGNHVGDWEHTMIRFVDGKPKAMFFSEHAGGVVLNYDAVEKIGKRPITYSATGTHANYPVPGIHRRILPWSLLVDFADNGTLWDPALNANIFSLNLTTDLLLPYTDPQYQITPTLANPEAPTRWFDFDGRWGDRTYPINDKRQYGLLGVWYMVSGPLGPKWKELNRRGVCMGYYPCYIAQDLSGWRSSLSHDAGLKPVNDGGKRNMDEVDGVWPFGFGRGSKKTKQKAKQVMTKAKDVEKDATLHHGGARLGQVKGGQAVINA
ncbi:hypothetical protein DFH27DRAFT_322324 [Peziza echinospora]|nr:hypothetical protein DFH27DRAFT_322324 [Peziza echinospora]